MLLQGINIVAFWVLRHEAVVVDRVDILFLGHGIAKAAAGRVLEGDAGGLVAEDSLNILAVVQLVVEALRHLYFAGVITILNHYQVVLFEERSPLLQEVQVPDRRYHNVQFVRERRAFGIQWCVSHAVAFVRRVEPAFSRQRSQTGSDRL